MLGSLRSVKQASIYDGFAFDPFSFQQDGLPASEVSISRDQIVAREQSLVHHSGSGRLAKPSPWGTSTSYSLPAFLAHSELGQTEKTSRRANAFRFTPDSRPSMPSLAARICRSLKASVPLAAFLSGLVPLAKTRQREPTLLRFCLTTKLGR
jgi:hypothetical protein